MTQSSFHSSNTMSFHLTLIFLWNVFLVSSCHDQVTPRSPNVHGVKGRPVAVENRIGIFEALTMMANNATLLDAHLTGDNRTLENGTVVGEDPRDILRSFEEAFEFHNRTGVCSTHRIPDPGQKGKSILLSWCCRGFAKSSDGTCHPHCPGGCANGVCSAPNICECNAEHVLDLSGNCVPTCPSSCLNGHCEQDFLCVCSPGFEQHESGKYCVPICTQACENGNCSAPNICTCKAGYSRNTMTGICEPLCRGGCVNGNCVGPNKCVCHEGYANTTANPKKCLPQCPQGCEHGRCTEPGFCSCNKGYVKSNETSGVCVPYCQDGCHNAICSRPGICHCNAGYINDPKLTFQNNSCIPFCNQQCINGFCSAPGVCTCDPGYLIDPLNKTGVACVPSCINCEHGDCIGPNLCRCHAGYEKVGKEPGCSPKCPQGCPHGLCSAPNVCSCITGYVKDAVNDKCVPSCGSGCVHGECTEPGVCTCKTGYKKDTTDPEGLRCVSMSVVSAPIADSSSSNCNPSCVNAVCSGRNLCLCQAGYIKDRSIKQNNVCKPHVKN